VLHKSFLVYYSEYFRKAPRGAWKEAEERIVSLVDIELGTFNYYATWLYRQEVPRYKRDWIAVVEAEAKEVDVDNLHLLMLKALVFGDRFMVPKFYREVNNRLIERLIEMPSSYANIIYAFDNLTAKKPLLKVLVDAHCDFWEPGRDDDADIALKAKLPREFLLRVMDAYAEGATAEDMNVCDYHEHKNDDEKAKCMKKK
jgi:hypothetical protein